MRYEIADNVLTWDSGTTTTTEITSATTFSTVLEGETYTATLRDGKLHWSDGDVWQREVTEDVAPEGYPIWDLGRFR